MCTLPRYESGYFEDFFRFFRLRPAALLLPFKVTADVGRLLWEAEACLRASFRPVRRRCDSRGDLLTFAATAPSVDPIERATLTRKSLSFTGCLCPLFFIILYLNDLTFGLPPLGLANTARSRAGQAEIYFLSIPSSRVRMNSKTELERITKRLFGSSRFLR
jgi:hypothetical protein